VISRKGEMQIWLLPVQGDAQPLEADRAAGAGAEVWVVLGAFMTSSE